jgi:osmotically-inducible protein OsmY
MNDDTEVQSRVETNIRKELGRSIPVGVTVRNHVATLTGEVATSMERWVAERAAERVPGVIAIVSYVEVRPATVQERTDEQLAEAVVNALREAPTVPADRIKVEVHRGWVTLRGQVNWSYQRSTAEHTVRDLVGVKGVSNLVSRAEPQDLERHR